MSKRPLEVAVVGIPGAWSTERLAAALAARGMVAPIVDFAEVCLDLERGRLTHGALDLCNVDGIVVKKIAAEYSPAALDRMEMLRFARGRGVRVFSDPDSMIPLIDRLTGTIRLRLGGVAMPETFVTESVSHAIEFVERMGDVIAKPLYTSKARGMARLQPGPALVAELTAFRAAGNPVMYLQRKLDIPGRDLGVSFVGGRYLATYARVKQGDAWSTSTTRGGRYEPATPTDAIIALAHRAQSLFSLDFTCVDVVETDDGPRVFEVSAFGGFRGLLDACGIDAAERYAEHIDKTLQMERA